MARIPVAAVWSSGRNEHKAWAGTFPRKLSCPGCDGGRRFYSSAPLKPPKNDVQSSSSIIYAPPPPSSASPQPLPGDDAPLQPKHDQDPTGSTTDTTEAATTAESAESAEPRPGVPQSDDSNNDASSSSSALPSAAESRRSALSARFSGFMDDLQARFVVASQALSDLTGYSAIEQIKARNAQLEADLAAAQVELRVARRAYQAVNERRAATQREVTTLLARKDSWAPPDLERFTALYRQDHELETSAQRAVERLKEAEADEARLSASVTSGILKRYHEEQVWSDRIRRQSTWGTWGLMAVNVLLFIVLQFFAEPWRRHRLMRGIAEAESGVLDDVRKELADVRAMLVTVAGGAPPAETAEGAAGAATATTTATTATAATAVTAATASDAASPEDIPIVATPAEAPRAAQAQVLDAPPPSPSPALRLPLFSATWPWSWYEVKAFGTDPNRWKAWALDLYSERLVNLRMRDVSLLALQSAAAGAAVVGGFVLALRRA